MRKTLPSVSRSLMPLRQRSSNNIKTEASNKSVESLLSSLHQRQATPSKPPRWISTAPCIRNMTSSPRWRSEVPSNGLEGGEKSRSLTGTLGGLRHIDSDCSSVETDLNSSDPRLGLSAIFSTLPDCYISQEKSNYSWKNVQALIPHLW